MNRISFIFCALLIIYMVICPLAAMPAGNDSFRINEMKTQKGTLIFTIAVGDSVKNQINGKYLGLYLKPAFDTSKSDSEWRFITWTLMPGSDTGMSKKTLTLTAPVPSGLTQGDYTCYVAGVTKKASNLQEKDFLSPPQEISISGSLIPVSSWLGNLANEINNAGSFCPQGSIPDYQIDSVEVKGNKMLFSPGDEVRVLLTVTNVGNNGCYDSPVPVLLSLGPQVLVPVQATIAPPGPGQTVSQELLYSIPENTSTGGFYLSAMIDPYHIRPEINRENNTFEGTSKYIISNPSKPKKCSSCGCK